MSAPANDVYARTAAYGEMSVQLTLSIVREDIHQILMSELRAAVTTKEAEAVMRIRERIEAAIQGRVK